MFILNNLQKELSPLESALTRNQGVERKDRPTPFSLRAHSPQLTSRRRFAVFAPCYVVSFHTNTNCPICKLFVLITMQQWGGWGFPSRSPFTIQTTSARVRCWGTNSLRQTQQELSSLGSAQPIVPNQLLVRGQVAELLRRHDFSPAPSSIPHREWLLVQSRGTKFRRPSIQS